MVTADELYSSEFWIEFYDAIFKVQEVIHGFRGEPRAMLFVAQKTR